MSIFNAIAQGSNIGAGINAFAQNQYAVNQDRELKAERQQQNAFAQQQGQAETMRQLFMDAVSIGPDAGFAYLSEMSPRFGVQPPDERVRGMLAQASAQMGQGAGAGINAITPSNYEPASIDVFRQTGNYSDLKPLQSEGVVLVAGVPHRRIGGNLYRITDAEAVGADAATIAGMTTGAREEAKTAAIPGRVEAETAAQVEAIPQVAAATRAAEAQAELPSARLGAETTIGMIEALRNHPGREAATGLSAKLPTRPASPAYDFLALLNQAKGGVFLKAFESLKGGGTITEIEGLKAEQAMARMDEAQSEEAFLQALNDYEAAIIAGLAKLERAGQTVTPQGETKKPAERTKKVGGATITFEE